MSGQKCVVEGCNLEYDVICSFSFYNVNVGSDSENLRQKWIEGAMKEESEGLWRHVSLQLCGYHFELDSQGLWIDSPMLPELLTLREQKSKKVQSESDKKYIQHHIVLWRRAHHLLRRTVCVLSRWLPPYEEL